MFLFNVTNLILVVAHDALRTVPAVTLLTLLVITQLVAVLSSFLGFFTTWVSVNVCLCLASSGLDVENKDFLGTEIFKQRGHRII